MLSIMLLSLSGQFTGNGVAITPRRSRTCSEIFVDIDVTNSKFTMYHGGYICQDMQATYDRYQMDIVNGELFSNGSKVGLISENELNINYENVDEGYIYDLKLTKLNESTLRYTESWFSEGKNALEVKGDLKLLD
jgi:hypothetical protein